MLFSFLLWLSTIERLYNEAVGQFGTFLGCPGNNIAIPIKHPIVLIYWLYRLNRGEK